MDTGVLTTLLVKFTNIFALGYGRLLPDAQHLLGLLAGLEIFFAGLWWAIDGGHKVEVELLKKIMQIGFFIWIVSEYQWITRVIVTGFITSGQKAGGSKVSLITNPSLIIDYGFGVTEPIFRYSDDLGLFDLPTPSAILFEFAGFFTLLAYFLLAITVFITYLEFYIVAMLGLILVPFGVFKYTSFLSEKVFGAVIAFGIRLMVLAFILAVIEPTLGTSTLPETPTLKQAFLVMLTALTIAALSWHAPGIASALLAGAPSLSAGAVSGTGLAVAGGMVAAGAAVTGAARQIAQSGHAATKAAAAAFGNGNASKGGGTAAGGGSAGTGSLGGTIPRNSAATLPLSGPSPPGPSGAAKPSTSAPEWSNNLKEKHQQAGKQETKGKVAAAGSSSRPDWATKMMVARGAIPQESHPGPGMSAPLRQ